MSKATLSTTKVTLEDPQKKKKKFSPYWITAALFPIIMITWWGITEVRVLHPCLLYTSDAADE